jgi:hypothetical protein
MTDARHTLRKFLTLTKVHIDPCIDAMSLRTWYPTFDVLNPKGAGLEKI